MKGSAIMKLTYDDLTDPRTVPFKTLEKLDAERKVLEKRAEKIRKLNIALVRLIQEGRITDTEDIDCAIAWLNHSNLEVWEIVNKVLEGK
jgi:hypothetical protein